MSQKGIKMKIRVQLSKLEKHFKKITRSMRYETSLIQADLMVDHATHVQDDFRLGESGKQRVGIESIY